MEGPHGNTTRSRTTELHGFFHRALTMWRICVPQQSISMSLEGFVTHTKNYINVIPDNPAFLRLYIEPSQDPSTLRARSQPWRMSITWTLDSPNHIISPRGSAWTPLYATWPLPYQVIVWCPGELAPLQWCPLHNKHNGPHTPVTPHATRVLATFESI